MKLTDGIRMASAILKAKYARPVPIFCQWEIGYDCNMDCKFCMPKRNKVLRAKYPQMNTEQAFGVIRQLERLGTRIINFSGGEPTLREDLPLLIREAKKRNMNVFFSTNGSMLKHRAKELLDADMIRVSIDGPKEIHDSIRRYPGAFDKAVDGIRALKDCGRKPMIVTAVTGLMTYDNLVYMAELAKSLDVQIDFSMVGVSLPSTIENPKPSDLIEEQTELVKNRGWFIESVLKLRGEYGNTIADSTAYLEMLRMGGLSKIGCKSLSANITIKPGGAVNLPCDQFTMKLAEGDLKEIFYGGEAEAMRKMTGKYWFCSLCYSRCNGLSTMLLDTRKLLSMLRSYKSFS